MAQLVKTWTFRSNSNPTKTYETSQYADGSTSCQCRGWCIAKHGVRSCTHTRKVEQGIADREAISVWNNPEVQQASAVRLVEENARRNMPAVSRIVDPYGGFDTVANPTKQAVSNKKKLVTVKKQVEKKKMVVAFPQRKISL